MASPPDVFDNKNTHREGFNAEAADREDRIRALSLEKRTQVNALEMRIADLRKDQDRRRPDDLNIERQKAALEHHRLDHPRPDKMAGIPLPGKSDKEIIEERAEKSLEAKYAKETADFMKGIDKEVRDIIQRPGRLDKELPDNATSSEIKERKFVETAFEMTSCAELTPEQTALANQIQAKWNAERSREHELDKGK